MPMWASLILSLGATYPVPPKTCLGTTVKMPEATADPMNERRSNVSVIERLLR